MCRTAATARRSPPPVAAAWPRSKRRNFSKSMGTDPMTNEVISSGQSNSRLAEDISAHLRRNIEQVEAQIEAACRAAGRLRESIELMAVSKTHPASAMVDALNL